MSSFLRDRTAQSPPSAHCFFPFTLPSTLDDPDTVLAPSVCRSSKPSQRCVPPWCLAIVHSRRCESEASPWWIVLSVFPHKNAFGSFQFSHPFRPLHWAGSGNCSCALQLRVSAVRFLQKLFANDSEDFFCPSRMATLALSRPLSLSVTNYNCRNGAGKKCTKIASTIGFLGKSPRTQIHKERTDRSIRSLATKTCEGQGEQPQEKPSGTASIVECLAEYASWTNEEGYHLYVEGTLVSTLRNEIGKGKKKRQVQSAAWCHQDFRFAS